MQHLCNLACAMDAEGVPRSMAWNDTRMLSSTAILGSPKYSVFCCKYIEIGLYLSGGYFLQWQFLSEIRFRYGSYECAAQASVGFSLELQYQRTGTYPICEFMNQCTGYRYN